MAITKQRKRRFVPMSLERHEALTGGSDQQAHMLDDMPPELKTTMIAALERDPANSGERDEQTRIRQRIHPSVSLEKPTNKERNGGAEARSTGMAVTTANADGNTLPCIAPHEQPPLAGRIAIEVPVIEAKQAGLDTGKRCRVMPDE
ncbi:MAG: hypothetical protein AAF982_08500 [Pseudomonadota bacterium]